MTQEEAVRVLGIDLTTEQHMVDPNVCWTAVIPGDSYSPALYGEATSAAISLTRVTYPEAITLGDASLCDGH